jgi:uncharacterized protein YciU (UPF0263 family)
MTPEEVRVLVEQIRERAEWDNEVAHSLEDDLYYRVVKALANADENLDFNFFDFSELVICAQTALKTKEMKFKRWMA